MFEFVEVKPHSEPVGTVIWLHGLGADGHDFVPIVRELGLDAHLPLRFVFPHAPVRPVSLNGGMPMRAWFDLFAGPQVDSAGIVAARAEVTELIERERGDGALPLALGGFSQGGALALATGLGHRRPLAGVVGLSTWLPEGIVAIDPAQNATPVMLAHGTGDPVVPIEAGRRTFESLKHAGCAVEWHQYPMAHQVCAEEIADLSEFLLRAFQRSIE